MYKTISANAIIAKIYRDFKPSNSGWVDDAIEWIAEAIDIMKVHQGYKDIPSIVEIIDYRGKLPSNLELFLGVEYQGMRLQRSIAINHINAKCSCLDNLVCHTTESYSLNPNYIQTTFQTGCVTIYHKGLEVDCDGFPFIIDSALYKNAVTWYVMSMMCLRGFKHQTIDYPYCVMMWEKTYPQAQNEHRFADIDSMESFKKMWCGMANSTNLTNQFFNNLTNSSDALIDSYVAGTKLQTFEVIGTNLNNT